MSRKDPPMHDTPATPSVPFGPLGRAMERFIVWLVVLPFLPFVLYERWRRRRERLTPAGAEKERAAENVMRKLASALRDAKHADPDRAGAGPPPASTGSAPEDARVDQGENPPA